MHIYILCIFIYCHSFSVSLLALVQFLRTFDFVVHKAVVPLKAWYRTHWFVAFLTPVWRLVALVLPVGAYHAIRHWTSSIGGVAFNHGREVFPPPIRRSGRSRTAPITRPGSRWWPWSKPCTILSRNCSALILFREIALWIISALQNETSKR